MKRYEYLYQEDEQRIILTAPSGHENILYVFNKKQVDEIVAMVNAVNAEIDLWGVVDASREE